jgi:predicted Zn finger-like uncharacterized protein
MPIKVQCESCGASFKAKEALAGKRVRCPKCKQPLTIPAAGAGSAKPAAPAKKSRPKAAAGSVRANPNPMMDLLDEANVKGVSRGPTCDHCAAELMPGAVICIECGYNLETGKLVATEVDEGPVNTAGMTDAERMMAKAEQDIDDMPVTGDGQDFGDGADSLVIAGVAGVILLLLVGIGLTIIFSMEQISKGVNSGAISMCAAIMMVILCGAWITIIAFKQQRPGHALACICTGFLYAVVYGFMQGKDLLIPTVVLLFSLVITAASGTYVGFNGWQPITGN